MSVYEHTLLPDLKDPVLIAAFATAGKGGSTAASALSYLAAQWNAQPVVEFEAHQHYSYTRMRPQLRNEQDGAALHWPTNTVYLARMPEAGRSVLLLAGIEPSLDWQGFIDTVEGFCRRNGISKAVVLHTAPATVSHRQPSQVMAIYGSNELRNRFGLPSTMYQEGPMDFSAVLALHLQAHGCETVDLIALEPFYTPGLPDAQAAIALVEAIDRYLGSSTPVESLKETAQSQREVYDHILEGSEQLSAMVRSIEQSSGNDLLDAGHGNLNLQEVMNEVQQILSGP